MLSGGAHSMIHPFLPVSETCRWVQSGVSLLYQFLASGEGKIQILPDFNKVAIMKGGLYALHQSPNPKQPSVFIPMSLWRSPSIPYPWDYFLQKVNCQHIAYPGENLAAISLTESRSLSLYMGILLSLQSLYPRAFSQRYP